MERLAEKCGIACYGAEIMGLAVKELHISVAEAQQYEEKITNSFGIYSRKYLACSYKRICEQSEYERTVSCGIWSAGYQPVFCVGNTTSSRADRGRGARRSAAVVSEFMSKGAFSSHGISDNIKNEKQQVCTQLCAACCFCAEYPVCTKLCPFL